MTTNNWEDGFRENFIKRFSVIGHIDGKSVPVIGKFLEGKKAGENYIGKVTTKELMDYLITSLGDLPHRLEQAAEKRGRELALKDFKRKFSKWKFGKWFFKRQQKDLEEFLKDFDLDEKYIALTPQGDNQEK